MRAELKIGSSRGLGYFKRVGQFKWEDGLSF